MSHSTELRGGGHPRSSKASGGEDLQVEHPVRCRDATAFHFHPTLARIEGPALIWDQVVQMRQAGEKRRLTPSGMMETLHGEELAVDGVMRLIQHGAHRRHLRGWEYRIPAGAFGLEPVANARALRFSHRRSDAIGTVTPARAHCHHP